MPIGSSLLTSQRIILLRYKMHPKASIGIIHKVYSSSAISEIERVTVQEGDLVLEEIKGFVTCAYNGYWWLACVLQVKEDSDIVSISLLHPHGPSQSFRYPPTQDILSISVGDVLTSVDPRAGKGNTYSLTQKASRTATEKFKKLDELNR